MLTSLQRAFLFPAPRTAVTPVHPRGELLELRDATGEAAFAFHLPALGGPDASAAPTVVSFHGNGEQLADDVFVGLALCAHGLAYLGVEYPGYGLAHAQTATEESLYRAAEAALRHLTAERGVANDRIVLLGRSLGAGVATEMAHRGLGSRLALVSPFTSVDAMARRMLLGLPAGWLVRDHFDNAAKAPAIALPTLVVHGTADTLIPIAMGRELAERFPNAELVEVDGAAHNDILLDHWGRPTVLERVASFALGL